MGDRLCRDAACCDAAGDRCYSGGGDGGVAGSVCPGAESGDRAVDSGPCSARGDGAVAGRVCRDAEFGGRAVDSGPCSDSGDRRERPSGDPGGPERVGSICARLIAAWLADTWREEPAA